MKLKRDVDKYDLSIAFIVLVAIIGAMLLLGGCTTVKKSVKEKKDIDTEKLVEDVATNKAVVEADKTYNVDVIQKTTKIQENEVEIVHEVFDTNITKEDGSHPLKERTTSRSRKVNKEDGQSVDNSVVVEKTKEDISSQTKGTTKEKDKSEIKTEEDKKTKVDMSPIVSWGAVAVVVIVIIVLMRLKINF